MGLHQDQKTVTQGLQMLRLGVAFHMERISLHMERDTLLCRGYLFLLIPTAKTRCDHRRFRNLKLGLSNTLDKHQEPHCGWSTETVAHVKKRCKCTKIDAEAAGTEGGGGGLVHTYTPAGMLGKDPQVECLTWARSRGVWPRSSWERCLLEEGRSTMVNEYKKVFQEE